MKDWTKLLQEDPKKQISAASEMDSHKAMNPPAFNITSQGKSSSQPIQKAVDPSIDKKKKTKMSSGIDKVNAPSPAGPVPIPYPNTTAPSPTKKEDDGLSSKLSDGLSSLENGFQSAVGKHENETSESNFSGDSSDYIQAVMFGKSMFKNMARFNNIRIMSVSAIGSNGCLQGPNIENFINMAPSVAAMTGDDKEMRKAIAKGVGRNFEQWRRHVTVPGLPWYPTFAAFPGPVAPPTPNIPSPLINCASSGLSKITMGSQLKKSIYGRLPSSMKNRDNEKFVQAIADTLAMQFLMWVSSQMVMNVLGKGPIPTFAPPYVPVGPVINGNVISVPGHLAG